MILYTPGVRRFMVVGLLALGCGPASFPLVPPGPPVRREAAQTTFAIIGDYGEAGAAAAAVAGLVRSWQPDFIATTGDNNYPDGMADTIDANVGQYYHEYIGAYVGSYGEGSADNRFFPTLGNHDWRTHDLAPYLDYFALPGNERYYAVSWGPVDLFMLDSDQAEPDGVDVGSAQARWLRDALAASTAPWQLVLLHHAPHSSGTHGSTPALQWPYAQWGADAVIAGHDHDYERVERDGIVYLVNGLGGHGKRYQFTTPVPGSALRFNEMHGAMRVQATVQELRFEFIRVDGRVVDTRVLTRA